jgi:hypothetical protein
MSQVLVTTLCLAPKNSQNLSTPDLHPTKQQAQEQKKKKIATDRTRALVRTGEHNIQWQETEPGFTFFSALGFLWYSTLLENITRLLKKKFFMPSISRAED